MWQPTGEATMPPTNHTSPLMKSCSLLVFSLMVLIAMKTSSGTTQQAESAPSGKPAQKASAPPPAPEFHGGYPAVSPDGKQIAYIGKRGGTEALYLSAADGTGEIRLSETPKPASPAWSTDGKHILFSTMDQDVSHYYSVDVDGKNQHEIARVSGRTPTLSPDGKHILYMAGTWMETQLMVANADGSNARMINDGKSPSWNNHWSPDGKRIAFTGNAEPKGPISVFTMNADGTDRHAVTRISADEGSAQWPVWSPDGKKLAIQVSGRNHVAHIWVVDATTGAGTKLAPHTEPYLDETPCWFPDGKRIAFQSDRTGRMEVWTMNADGSNVQQFTK
jgi:TolB protein